MLYDLRVPFTSLHVSVIPARAVTCEPGWWIERGAATVICLGHIAVMLEAVRPALVRGAAAA
jgi:hypothetical protein